MKALVAIEHLFAKDEKVTVADAAAMKPSSKDQEALLLRALYRSIVQCATTKHNATDEGTTVSHRFRLLLPPEHSQGQQHAAKRLKVEEEGLEKLEAEGFHFHPLHLELHEVETPEGLLALLHSNLDAFKNEGGAILLLYALVLTRGIKQV